VFAAVSVVDDQGKKVPPGTLGNIVAKLPLPPGAFQTLWNDEERFAQTYFTKFEVCTLCVGCYTSLSSRKFSALKSLP